MPCSGGKRLGGFHRDMELGNESTLFPIETDRRVLEGYSALELAPFTVPLLERGYLDRQTSLKMGIAPRIVD